MKKKKKKEEEEEEEARPGYRASHARSLFFLA